jgi:hypothetical protein
MERKMASRNNPRILIGVAALKGEVVTLDGTAAVDDWAIRTTPMSTIRKLMVLAAVLASAVALHLVRDGFDQVWVLGALCGLSAAVLLFWIAAGLMSCRQKNPHSGTTKRG